MTLDRRRFVVGTLAGSIAAGLAAACGARKDQEVATMPTPAPAPAPPAKKTILVLGGTGFLGPHVVTTALARGHTVTLFNRGKTHPSLFPEVEKLHGDRDGHLEALAGRRWDAVVDPSGYLPRLVKASAELLAPSIGHYVFISTISVYDKENVVNADESNPVATLADPANEDVKANYGALKALCERAAEAAMPGRVANLRPGLIIGPGDPTGRFSHWPTRLAAGGEVLAPGDGATPVQYIDGRDLGAWIVRVIEDKTVGTMNALGPASRVTIKQVLDECNRALGGKAQLTWVDAGFLDKQGVEGWSELPMWIDNKGDFAGFGTLSNARAVKAGLVFRPVGETAKDTLAWLDAASVEGAADGLTAAQRTKARTSGIAPEKEAKVLAAWKART
jgi:2'-hydroxyisoflavone reductase